MAKLYPNISVALYVNEKLSGSFKNSKSQSKKDFYTKRSDFFEKPKKPTLAGFFTHF